MAKKVKAEGLAQAIIEVLETYNQEVTDQIKEDVRQTAKECAKEIKEKAPVDDGDYKKGWKTKVMYESRDDIRIDVYNSKEPSFTHLLEFGHAKASGGRVEGKEHIYPAAEQAEEKLVGKAKVAVKRR